MECKHEDVAVTCDGSTHWHQCETCNEVTHMEACEEAGTWASEESEEE